MNITQTAGNAQAAPHDATAFTIYDAFGNPVWVQGERDGAPNDGPVTLNMRAYSGYCVTCDPIQAQSYYAGTVMRHITGPNTGVMSSNVSLPGQAIPAGGEWNRNNSTIARLTYQDECLSGSCDDDPPPPPPPPGEEEGFGACSGDETPGSGDQVSPGLV